MTTPNPESQLPNNGPETPPILEGNTRPIPEPEQRGTRAIHALWPFGIVLLLALPALYPLLSDWFTCGYDNSFHLWRAVEVHNLLRQGVLFPRWAADMAHGYGFLLFNFVSPLSAYVAAGLRFAGLPWVGAVNGTFALGLLLSGFTAYLFVRDHFGRAAGLVSAVAYMYAPFQAYDVYNRGGLSQAFAWWLPPLLLWSLSRWRGRRGGVVMLLLAALSLAALILTHNVFAFLFSPLVIGMLIIPQSTADGSSRWPTLAELGRGALPLVLGLGLAAFFWLPGLFERDWVQTQRLLGVWVFDYRNNFLRLSDLLASPRVTDPTLINDWPPRALGLVPFLVALLPLLGWRRFSRAQRWLVALMLAGLLVSGLMILPVSRLFWDIVPLLVYAQFPWRFLGPAAFCAAVLAGAAVPALGSTPQRQTLVSVVLIAALFLANLGWFFPDHCPPPGDTTVAGMIRWEQATDTLGATAGGEFLPIWVKRMPDYPHVLADYAAGGPVRRLDTDILPVGTEIGRADYGPLGAEIQLEAPEPFEARYLAFYYPGWQVSVDGQSVEVTPSEPHGLITFDVPAGRHVIDVRFGATSLRTAATLLSLVAFLGLFVAVFVLRRDSSSHRFRGPANVPTRDDTDIQSSIRTIFWYLILVFILVVARFLVAEGHTPLRRTRLSSSDGGDSNTTSQIRDVGQPYAVDFGHRWVLLGHDNLPQQIASDETLEAVLYWQAANGPQGGDYAASLALLDVLGQRWTHDGMRSPRWHRPPPPVYNWPGDGYAMTAYLADVLPGTPPGDYHLVLTTFDKKDPQTPLTAYDSEGTAMGPSLDLGPLRVERPSTARNPEEVAMGVRLEAAVGPLILAGVNLDRAEAAPGDPTTVTLFWSVPAADDQVPDLTLHLALVDETGNEVKGWDLPPVRADWPTTQWQSGDLWRGQHVLRLPGALESGTYTWQASLFDAQHPDSGTSATPEPPVELGQLRINSPERLWQPPPLQHPLDADLGGRVRLLGANLEPTGILTETLEPGSTLTVTLAWQGQQEMETSYRVFVHLLDKEGNLWAQSDGEPAGWSRPTTGWAPGEVVLDKRTLEIPADAAPGSYTLVAGLYHHGTGERLTLPDGGTAVLIISLKLKQP